MKWNLSIVGFLAFFVASPAFAEPIRVACVGDTPTRMSDYTKDLGKLLNAAHDKDKSADTYDVKNFGVDDSTIVQTEKPWLKTAKAEPAKDFQPNIVVIMFGTQDCQKGKNLDKIGTFADEYKKLISEFSSLPTKPKIYICLPPPIMGNGNWGMTDENLETKIVPLVKQVAKDLDLTIIDVNTPLVGKTDCFHDNVHVAGDAHTIIADTVFKAIAGKDAAK